MVDVSTRLSGKYLSLTTYKRDGTPVPTPVWFVVEGEKLLVQTDVRSGKVKRIRANPRVTVAPCNARGHLRGERVEARAEVLGPTATAHIEELVRRKYRWDMLVIGPLRRVQTRFGRDRGPTVGLAITPDASA